MTQSLLCYGWTFDCFNLSSVLDAGPLCQAPFCQGWRASTQKQSYWQKHCPHQPQRPGGQLLTVLTWLGIWLGLGFRLATKHTSLGDVSQRQPNQRGRWSRWCRRIRYMDGNGRAGGVNHQSRRSSLTSMGGALLDRRTPGLSMLGVRTLAGTTLTKVFRTYQWYPSAIMNSLEQESSFAARLQNVVYSSKKGLNCVEYISRRSCAWNTGTSF